MPDQYRQLKRVRSVLEAGVVVSFSSDRPIVPGDPREGVFAATNRPDGFDQDENIPLEVAAMLYTLGGWISNEEQQQGGEIAPGQVADFQVYDRFAVDGLPPQATYRAGICTAKRS